MAYIFLKFNKKQVCIKTPMTYEHLIEAIKSKFSLTNNFLSLKFEDQNKTEIEVSNDKEYQNCVVGQEGIRVKILQEKGNKSKNEGSLSFSRDSNNKSQSKEEEDSISNYLNEKLIELKKSLNTVNDELECQEDKLNNLFTLISNKKSGGKDGSTNRIKQLKSSNVIHQRFSCSNCQEVFLKGRRYQCSLCSNINYCSKCRDVIKHDHDFIVITKPKNKLAAQSAKQNIELDFPNHELDKSNSLFEIEMLNTGDIPWPNNIVLNCLEDSEIIFKMLPSEIKNIYPQNKAIFFIQFDDDDLNDSEEGIIFNVKAQLMNNNAPISSIMNITVRIKQNKQNENNDKAIQDPQQTSTNSNNNLFSNQKKQDDFYTNDNCFNNKNNDYSNNYFNHQPNDNPSILNYGQMNYNQNIPLKNSSQKLYRNDGLTPQDSSESNNPQTISKSNQFNNQNQTFQQKRNVDNVQYDLEDEKEDLNEFKFFGNKTVKKTTNTENDKLDKIYSFLNKYNFEQVIPKKIIQETIIENNYQTTAILNKLWDLYEQYDKNE